MIEKMGRKWGCHTCGSRMLFSRNIPKKFHGDHMPPKSIAETMNKSFLRRKGILPKIKYRFYPQCVNCSNKQGSILAKATSKFQEGSMPSFLRARKLQAAGGGRSARFHGARPRLSHLTGGILAATTVVGATKQEVKKGNPHRFETVHRNLEKTFQTLQP